MALNKVNGSQLMQSQMVDKFKGTQRSDQMKKDAPTVNADGTAAKPTTTTDSAEISDTARMLMDLRKTVDVGRAAVEALPDTRAEKLADVRQKLESGYYNSVEVRDKVASKLGTVIEEMDNL